jgi:hypothetical protein
LVATAVIFLIAWSGTDAEFWVITQRAVAAVQDHSYSITDEMLRYVGVFQDRHSNGVRQLTVLLPLVSVAMFLKRDRSTSRVANLPMVAWVLATFLLALSPSKWIWHFGALTPLSAACFGVEWHRWRSGHQERRQQTGAAVILTVAILTYVISWTGGYAWDPLLIRVPHHEQWAPSVAKSWLDPRLLVPAVLGMAATTSFAWKRNRSSRGSFAKALKTASVWAAPGFVVAAIGVTLATIGFDGLLRTSGWTLTKQNLGLLPAEDCGLASEVTIAASGDGATKLSNLLADLDGPVLASPQIRMYFPCTEQPSINDGLAEIPLAILAVEDWPHLRPTSPLYLLSDVASLRTLDAKWTRPGNGPQFEVILVEPQWRTLR